MVLDPLAEFLDRRISLNNETSVRRLLSPLAGIAEARGCVMVLVRHLNKSEGRRALYRGSASMALIASCRSAWLVADEPADPAGAPGPARRVLAQQKNNLGPPQPSLAFAIVPGTAGGAALSWLGPVEMTADGLLARRRPAGPLKPGERARAFLRQILAGGPLTADEVLRRVREEGLSVKTVRNVTDQAGVCQVWGGLNGRPTSFWMLSGQSLPPGVTPRSTAEKLDELLGPALDDFPEPNPLED